MSRWLSGVLVFVVALCLALPAQANSEKTQRFEEFLAAQGKFFWPDPPGAIFVEPDPNFMGWGTNFSKSPVYYAGVDYAGLATEAYAPDKQPEITGSVTERPLPDGRAEVTVIMHTKGANVWVIQLDLNQPLQPQIGSNPTLFGHYPRDVALGAAQALGDCLLHIVFTNTSMDAPLPDLIQLFSFPEPGQEVKYVSFNTQAKGPLTDTFVSGGASGSCHIIQTGLFDVAIKQLTEIKGKAGSHSRVAYDFFPAENIKLQVVGKGK